MTREQWLSRLAERDNMLGTLLGVYFGQDWLDDHGLPWTNVVAAFALEGSLEHAQAVLIELDRLLGNGLSDADIDWLLWDGLHVAFNTEHFGFASGTDWLRAVRDELRGLC